MTMDTDAILPTETIEIAATPPARKYVLEIQDDDGVRSLPLGEESLVVGSSPRATLIVRDPLVSGVHCCIGVAETGLLVRDLGSRNATFVNGARVVEATITHGMTIGIGKSSIVCHEPPSLSTESIPAGEPLEGVAGGSVAMRRVATQVRRLASLSSPVLIAGETGAGKELIARALHREGARAEGPFVALNVASLPRELVESELFGHERGAFTGATAPRAGAFEQADGGTLFLDEIGELPLDAQPKLLRALDGYEIRRLGSTGAGIRPNTRVIAATHVPLLDRVDAGRFRRDLYHRLEVFVVEIPPLRERQGDLGAIARHILMACEEEFGFRQLTPGALTALAAYDWPGNVRELGNVLRRAAALSPTAWVTPETVARAFRKPSRIAKVSEKRAEDWVRAHNGNVSAAARAAGMPRSSFRKLLKPREP